MRTNRRSRIIIGIFILVVAGIVAYAIYHTVAGPSANGSAGQAPAATGAARGDNARQFISQLKQAGTIDYAAAYQQAEIYRKDGRMADATVLYFFAARGGNGPAAFALAELNDPNHFQPQQSLLDQPAPYQAFRWYTVAEKQGVSKAAQRLEALHQWAKMAAKNGNTEAQHLLLEWQ